MEYSPILLPVLFIWLAANLAMWRYGWQLLRRTPSIKAADRSLPPQASWAAASGERP